MNTSKSTPVRAPAQPGQVSSDKLLGDRKQLDIVHNGEHYTLRITANNKLILTK